MVLADDVDMELFAGLGGGGAPGNKQPAREEAVPFLDD